MFQIWINTWRPAAYTKIKLSYFIVGWKRKVCALSNIWFLLDDKSSLVESSFGRGSRWASNLYDAGCLVLRRSFKSLTLPSFRIYLLSYLYSLFCPRELNVVSLTHLRYKKENSVEVMDHAIPYSNPSQPEDIQPCFLLSCLSCRFFYLSLGAFCLNISVKLTLRYLHPVPQLHNA